MTDPQPISLTALSKKEEEKNVTYDMWHVTHDPWHVTCDMWHVVGVNILSKLQLPSSSGLWFMIFWRLGRKGSLSDSLNESINHKADCRTALATQGLLKRLGTHFYLAKWYLIYGLKWCKIITYIVRYNLANMAGRNLKMVRVMSGDIFIY